MELYRIQPTGYVSGSGRIQADVSTYTKIDDFHLRARIYAKVKSEAKGRRTGMNAYVKRQMRGNSRQPQVHLPS